MDTVKSVVVGGTGDGLQAGSSYQTVTPAGQPNIISIVVGPLAAMAVRFGHLFFVAASGVVTTGLGQQATDYVIVPFTDFSDLLMKAAVAGAITAVVGALKDMATLFLKLEQKYPFLTGSV